jgi:hypothetical protein
MCAWSILGFVWQKIAPTHLVEWLFLCSWSHFIKRSAKLGVAWFYTAPCATPGLELLDFILFSRASAGGASFRAGFEAMHNRRLVWFDLASCSPIWSSNGFYDRDGKSNSSRWSKFDPLYTLIGWSKNIFIPKTIAPAVFLFSFATRGSHHATWSSPHLREAATCYGREARTLARRWTHPPSGEAARHGREAAGPPAGEAAGNTCCS